jgi:hypothetical protein
MRDETFALALMLGMAALGLCMLAVGYAIWIVL